MTNRSVQTSKSTIRTTAMKRAAFVTGGASGIGLSICQHLARAGHSVAVADYNGDAAEDEAKAIGDMTDAGWGRVVMISSSSAQRGAAGMTHYAASKGGVIAFGKALALEFAKRGVTVNNIAPSVVETPMVEQQRAAGAVPSREVMARGVPVGRMGTGDDIAAACLYLVSEEASYVTGQTVSVNGGSFVGW